MNFDSIRAREAQHFLPVVARMPVALVRGAGSHVFDTAGRRYLDLTAGWGVVAIGHSHPKLVAAISEQAARLMQTTNLYYTLPQLDLCEALAAKLPPALTRSFFVSSGSEAIEGALKLAHRATGRRKFISCANSFHGRTLGALHIGGQEKHRAPYRALMPEQVVVPFDDAEAAARALDAETAAFIVEPVQGEGGVHVPSAGYLARLRECANEVGALLIFDEIQTGIGRTGRMFALEHEGVVPDVLTLGKGLGGGFPIAAFVCSEAVAQTVKPGDHGGTYAGNPLACAAACATLEVLREENLVARAAELGARLQEKLQAFARAHPECASAARGRGLLQALVLTDEARAAALPTRALEAGLLINVTAGRVLRLFPALNIEERALFEAVDQLFELIRA